MKIHSYFYVLVLIVITLIFSVYLLTLTYAQERPVDQYDNQHKQSLGEVEIIMPGRIKETDNPPQSDAEQAIADAKRDVKAHINQTLWFTNGCFFPILGPFLSQRNIKSIPTARTLGKSPQYVAFYIDAYRIQMKKQRYNWALGGCIVGGLTDACLVGLLINWYID